MKILLTHRYFSPDTPPYGMILREIGEHLASRGHAVSVFSTMPSYRTASAAAKSNPASGDRLTVKRIKVLSEARRGVFGRVAQAANAAYYAMRLFVHVLFHDAQVVTASTFPPILPGLAASLACRLSGKKLVYHCMDIYPEVLTHGVRRPAPWILRWLKRLDSLAVRGSARVVVLSSDMQATLEARGDTAGARIEIINNIDLPDFSAGPPDDLDAFFPPGATTVLFAGNIGNFQNLDTAIDAAHALRDRPSIRFLFMGDGAARHRLEARAGDLLGRTVHFLGHRTIATAKAGMARASVNLVSLQGAMHEVSYPSKTLSILAAGGVILALVDPASELARDVATYGAGWTCAPGDSDAMARLLRKLDGNPALLGESRQGAARLHRERFATPVALQKWTDLFAALEQ